VPPLLELALTAAPTTALGNRAARTGGEHRAAVDAFTSTRPDAPCRVVALDVLGVLFPPLTTCFGTAPPTPALDATATRRIRSECLERQPRQAPAAPRLITPNLHPSSAQGRDAHTALRTRRPRSRTSRVTLTEAGRSAVPEFLREFISRKSGRGSFRAHFRRRGISLPFVRSAATLQFTMDAESDLGQRAGMSLERRRAITLAREYVARWDPRELFRGVRESTR
jgi:hypothetical protein